MRVTIDELNKSTLKAKSGKMWKGTVLDYYFHINHYNYILKNQINKDTYTPKKCSVFKITEPKERIIKAPNFRDRIVQKHVNNKYIKPIMKKYFIKENCACQENKGTDYARNILKGFYRSYFSKYKSNEGYILKVDIKHFFNTINGDVVAKQISRYFYPDIQKYLKMWSVSEGEIGVGLGCETNQFISLISLHDLDMFLKTVKRVKYYVRYQDDMLLFSKTKEEANQVLSSVINYLSKLKLKINIRKTNFFKLKDYVEFLGFRFKLKKIGKVIIELLPRKIYREIRRVKKQIKILSLLETINCIQSWLAFANKSNCKRHYSLWRRVNEFVANCN